MNDTVLIWLGVFVALVVAGANDSERRWLRYIGLIAVGLLMLLFYME